MAQFQVDSEAVFSASNAARATGERIEADVASMLAQLMNLQGSWTGQAAAAFQSIIAEWHSTQQRVSESLTAINQALGLAGQQYFETEQANANLFARR